MFYQQGDVLLKKYNGMITGKKLHHLILAEGEVTGHKHEVIKGEAELIESNKNWYLKVLSEEAIVTHQEHKPITIPKGVYEVSIVEEYDHFEEEARKVRD